MQFNPTFLVFKNNENLELSISGTWSNPKFCILNSISKKYFENVSFKSVQKLVDDKKISKFALDFIKK